MVVLLAALTFAQDSPPPEAPVAWPAAASTTSSEEDGSWSIYQSQWVEYAKADARLALLLGDRDPAWYVANIPDYASYHRYPAPPRVDSDVRPWMGPKGKAGKIDEDHDGKPDWLDLCPTVKAKKSDFGCPEVTDTMRAAVSGHEAQIAAARDRAQQAMAAAARGEMDEIYYSHEFLALGSDLRSYSAGEFLSGGAAVARRGRSKTPAAPAPACAPEDYDGFMDDDGCADPDNDADGTADIDDKCPNDPEDNDAFEDGDGCPDVDNDVDGISDANDRCPTSPETFNLFEDGDGCPDTASAVGGLQRAPVPAARPQAPAAPAYTPAPSYSPPVQAYVPPQPKPLPSVDARLATGKKAKNDTAVVIGLENYFAIPGVPYAKRDADAFYSFLLYTRGVPQERIQILSSGGKEHIAAAVERAGKEVGPGGTVWIYFAGHGAANPSSGQRMLLGDDVRSDAIGFASRGIEVGDIEKLASANGGTPMLVLDTCYSGTGRAGGTLIAGTRFAVPQFATKTSGTAMEWNAASADQISAPLEPVQHGAFTYFAVGALRGWADGEIDGVRDGKVTGSEAQAYVRRALRANQKNDQTPVWVGPNDPILSEGAPEKGPDF